MQYAQQEAFSYTTYDAHVQMQQLKRLHRINGI
jgi:hypothetical protein